MEFAVGMRCHRRSAHPPAHWEALTKKSQQFCHVLFPLALWLLSFTSMPGLVRVADAQVPGVAPQRNGAASHANETQRHRKYDVDHIGERGTGRGINLYSLNREHALGQTLADSIDRTSKLVNDVVVKEYVNKLGQAVVRNSDSQVPFTIKVLDSDDVGIFALPGGFLYVDRGLITVLDGEAELASMMAHEIAHVAARHATRGLTRKRILSMATTAAMLAGPVGVIIDDLSGVGGPLSRKKFARDAEYEADLLGIEYAYAAGYDPEAFVSALEKVHAHEINMQDVFKQVPGYTFLTKLPFHRQIATAFSEYPPMEERIRHLQKEIVEFLPKRNQYIIDSSDFDAVKAELMAANAPVLLRPRLGVEAGKGPVLRRRQD